MDRTPDLPIWVILRHIACHIEDRMEAALSKSGLSLAKFGVLHVLITHPDSLPLSELARKLSCVKSNVTQLVDRLEADGLVQRRDHHSDRRSVRAVVTAEGRRRWKAGSEAMAAVERELFGTFPAHEMEVLRKLLAKFELPAGALQKPSAAKPPRK